MSPAVTKGITGCRRCWRARAPKRGRLPRVVASIQPPYAAADVGDSPGDLPTKARRVIRWAGNYQGRRRAAGSEDPAYVPTYVFSRIIVRGRVATNRALHARRQAPLRQAALRHDRSPVRFNHRGAVVRPGPPMEAATHRACGRDLG